jgi:excisionase family DNA binding protein
MNDLHADGIFSDGLEKVTEAAKFLGLSRSTVYKLVSLGVLPSVKIGACRRIPKRAVRSLAQECLDRVLANQNIEKNIE